MRIEIKNVKYCRNKAYGNFKVVGYEKMLVTVSLKKNQYVAEYASTLLHEMLHAWLMILKAQGVKIKKLKEHEFIYSVESKILKELNLLGRIK